MVTFNCLNHKEVQVIGVHSGEFTAQILVNDLPLSSSAKIDWWIKNSKPLLDKYHLNDKDIYIFAWGNGYQEEGKADRLCFADVAPPRNCIDKNILMSVSKTRSGKTEYRIDDEIWLQEPGQQPLQIK
ncbi:DUF943 family protein [Cronobacter sakazakii]|nr:DUF943 family protein [Cronobacter sakazakii]EKK4045161.1 DUF943 family protein [Cronobacter sakazakii]ELL7786160.1 DUF943 family protein [Cronobacter sakazakii]ELY2755063.1 DUF943 family protein [Cronobacter sakazakii]ELY3570503.1 DUF943 family protein [Cronobacter sakazakii]